MKLPKEITDEIEHLKQSHIPRCITCKKNMKNGYDSITKKINKGIWEFDCDCYPKEKRGRLMMLG